MRNITLALVALLMACTARSQQKETREIDAFNFISLGINADVVITQGKSHKVVIEAKPDDLEKIETVVSDKRLKIRNKQNNGWFGNNLHNVKIYITLTDFAGASVSGSGSITQSNNLQGNEVKLNVSGSGNIDLFLECKMIDTHISGSGNITIQGKTEQLELHISGSGDLKAEDMEAANLEAHISGSGSASVFATQSIDAHISGSGIITYKGNPAKIKEKVSGSGGVHKM